MMKERGCEMNLNTNEVEYLLDFNLTEQEKSDIKKYKIIHKEPKGKLMNNNILIKEKDMTLRSLTIETLRG